MANHDNTKKAVRKTKAVTVRNKDRVSRIRTFIKKVELAIGTGKYDDAVEALKNAQPELMRGVTKGVVKKNAASRKLSRLSARIKALKVA